MALTVVTITHPRHLTCTRILIRSSKTSSSDVSCWSFQMSQVTQREECSWGLSTSNYSGCSNWAATLERMNNILSNIKKKTTHFFILSLKVVSWIHLKNVSQKTDCFSGLFFFCPDVTKCSNIHSFAVNRTEAVQALSLSYFLFYILPGISGTHSFLFIYITLFLCTKFCSIV